MNRRTPKLYQGFSGDAVELRDVLVKHFKELSEKPHVGGTDYATGPTVGGCSAYYRRVAEFLKKLVINGEESKSENEGEGSA